MLVESNGPSITLLFIKLFLARISERIMKETMMKIKNRYLNAWIVLIYATSLKYEIDHSNPFIIKYTYIGKIGKINRMP